MFSTGLFDFLQATAPNAQPSADHNGITEPGLNAGPARRWAAAAVPILVGHAALLASLMWARTEPLSPPVEPPDVIVVSLVEPPPPPAPTPVPEPSPEPTADTTQASAPAQAAPPDTAPKPRPPVPAAARPRRVLATPPPDVEPLPAAPAPPGPPLPLLGAAQLAGATTAGAGSGGGNGGGSGGGGAGSGAGSGGGSCDMVRRVQDRLRRTPSVRAAVAEAGQTMNAPGQAMLIWDGDWLQSRGQSGKGLAGVRQAIALEVAFSPAECRAQTMAGLAVLSLEDGPTGARLALGRGSWRWSDLLSAG